MAVKVSVVAPLQLPRDSRYPHKPGVGKKERNITALRLREWPPLAGGLARRLAFTQLLQSSKALRMNSSSDGAAAREFLHKCAVCGAKSSPGGSLSKCGKCKGEYYCSRECQASAWPEHKKVCSKGGPSPSIFTDASAYGFISYIEINPPLPCLCKISLTSFAQRDAAGNLGTAPIAEYTFTSTDQLPIELQFLLACGLRPNLDVVKSLAPRLPMNINELRLPGPQFSALDWASRKGNVAIIRWLVTEGKADVNVGAPLVWACYTNRVAIAKMLVDEFQADVNQIEPGYGKAAVHLASENGSLEALQWLIEEKGVSPSTPDRKGMSPLQCARASPCQASDAVIAYLRSKR